MIPSSHSSSADLTRGILAGPEFGERQEELPGVARAVFVKEVNVARNTRVTVVDDGLSAHEQIVDALLRKQAQEGDDVVGTRPAPDLDLGPLDAAPLPL